MESQNPVGLRGLIGIDLIRDYNVISQSVIVGIDKMVHREVHNELKCEKNTTSNVCLGGSTITSKTKINIV